VGESEKMNNQIKPDFSSTLRSAATPDAPRKVMLSVEHDGAQALVRINSSSLSIIQTCPRKTQYVLQQGWKSKAISPALVYGTAIHKALEVFYSCPPKERGEMPAHFDDNAMLIAHGHPAPAKHFLYDAIAAFVKAAEPLRMLPDTDKRSLSSGVWTLGHYFRVYLRDAYVTYADSAGPCVERTFETDLYESKLLKIRIFGTIDFVLKNAATGEILPGDHKTASQMGSDFLNRCKPNHQYTGYILGAQRELGLSTENFMINGVQVKPRPLTARGSPPTFTRQITRRSDEDVQELIHSITWAVRSYLEWEKENVWPLGTADACSSWGGCQFLDICSAPNALRNNILEAKFERQI